MLTATVFCRSNPMNNFAVLIMYLQFYKSFSKELEQPKIYGTIFFFLFLQNTFHTYITLKHLLQCVSQVWHFDTCNQITVWVLSARVQCSGRRRCNIRIMITLKAWVQMLQYSADKMQRNRTKLVLVSTHYWLHRHLQQVSTAILMCFGLSFSILLAVQFYYTQHGRCLNLLLK